MGTGYIRQDSANNIADGNVINASDLDGEFDGIVAAFGTSGHAHNGSAGEGGAITKFGPSLQYETDATALFPGTTNSVDLGKSTKQFKDLYIDGVINADSVSADAVTVTNALSAESTLKVGGAATLESTLAVSAESAFKGAVSVETTLRVTGDTDVEDLSASGTFDVAGSATFANNVTVNANLAVGDIIASAIETGAPSTFSAKTTFTTDATVGGTFAVGGTTNLATATVSGTIDITGNASVGGTHTVDGDLKNTSGNLTVDPATQILEIKGSGSTEGQIQLNCAVNTHGQIITAADHGVSATNTLTLPGGDTIGNANATLVSDTGTQTLTNKTLTSPAINGATIDSAVKVSSVGTLSAGTNADINGTLDVGSTASVGGAFRITNNVTASGTLNVGTDASITGTFNVTGSAGLSSNVNIGGTLTGASTVSDQDGDLRKIPQQRSEDANFTIATTDNGNFIRMSSSGITALIASADSVAMGDGAIVSLVNTAGTATVSSHVTSFISGGVSATSTMTLAPNGVASLLFVSSGLVYITGNIS